MMQLSLLDLIDGAELFVNEQFSEHEPPAAPDCRPVFSVDLLQPFGAIVTRLILGAGCAVRITDC